MDLFAISYVLLWAVVVLQTVALFVVLRAVGNLYLGTRSAIDRDGLAVGSIAPDFVAQTSDGATVQSHDFRGRWQVLLFALPTCQICRSLMPELATLARDLGDQVGVHVLVRGEPRMARPFCDLARGVDVLAVAEAIARRSYRIRVSPYVTVLDPSGVVKAKGLVDRVEHIEHLLGDAGVRHPVALRHAQAGGGHQGVV